MIKKILLDCLSSPSPSPVRLPQHPAQAHPAAKDRISARLQHRDRNRGSSRRRRRRTPTHPGVETGYVLKGELELDRRQAAEEAQGRQILPNPRRRRP